MKWILYVVAALACLGGLLVGFLYLGNMQPREVQPEPVTCPAETPRLKPGQPVKVVSWNVQYLAGKNYVFWYDKLDESGPDTRPSRADVAATLQEVARVIDDEQPDILMLQEVNDGAVTTDHEDQLARILGTVRHALPCHASAFYWKGVFVPHPKIMGAGGMKLSVASRYAISAATRHQLPRPPAGWVMRQIGMKRAILEVRLPREDGSQVAALTTHFDAFAQGSDTMERQVHAALSLLGGLTRQSIPWVFAGDLNLLPPGPSYARLLPAERAYFNPTTELAPFYDAYRSVPNLEEVNGPDHARWHTHFPNGVPELQGPDRAIDHLFVSPEIRLGAHTVRQHDTLKISDHVPVVAELHLP
jgi:endonuclease/exonuclease/phosphatase family metal-dependent hydrolase